MRSQALTTLFLVALIYPFFEGMIWNGNFGLQRWLAHSFGASFHDFAGSVVVHAMGGWIALAGGFLIYGVLKLLMGIRLSQEEEFNGADLSIHRISANSEENMF